LHRSDSRAEPSAPRNPNWKRISNPRYFSHFNLGIGRLRSQPLSSELSLPSDSRLPDNRSPCSASLAAFTTISPSPPAEVSGMVPAGKPRYGPSGLMSPFPVFGSPVVHGNRCYCFPGFVYPQAHFSRELQPIAARGNLGRSSKLRKCSITTVPAGKPRYGPSGLMSPFPVFGSPAVHGMMPSG